MPVPTSIGKALSAEQLDQAHKNLDALIGLINGFMPINLTKQERQGIQSVAEVRLPFLQKAYDSLIPSYPSLKPPFGNEIEAMADYSYLKQHLALKLKILQLVEVYSDHELAAGHRAYEYMRDFYHMAQRAVERNVPGADTAVDELSPLFNVTNPTPPMPGGGTNG